jgi:hypothetical protein
MTRFRKGLAGSSVVNHFGYSSGHFLNCYNRILCHCTSISTACLPRSRPPHPIVDFYDLIRRATANIKQPFTAKCFAHLGLCMQGMKNINFLPCSLQPHAFNFCVAFALLTINLHNPLCIFMIIQYKADQSIQFMVSLSMVVVAGRRGGCRVCLP